MRRTNTVLTPAASFAHSKGVRHSFLWVGLLLGLTASSSFAGQFLSVGIKAGIPFTDAFNSDTFAGSPFSNQSYSGGLGYLVGPMGEVHLPLGLSVEADALYRPLYITNVFAPGHPSSDTYSSWEFPILAKWRFPFPLIKPYIEGGPSFRTVGGRAGNYLSNDGLTFGVGIEVRVARVRIGPELRFTHWGSDASGASVNGFSSNQNQGEFLVGFSF